jgi:hypothetical protein
MTESQKTYHQPSDEVRKPPKTRRVQKPTTPAAGKIERARFLSSLTKYELMIPTAEGTVIAAPIPCNAREMANWTNELAEPSAIVQIETHSMPAQNMSFRPYLLDRTSARSKASEGERIGRNQPLHAPATDIEFLLDGWEGDVDACHVSVVEKLRAGCHYKGTAAGAKGANVRMAEFSLFLRRCYTRRS